MNAATRSARRAQCGLVLLVALIVLVAMTLGGLALIRSTSTGILAAGNLAWKQNATLAGDIGIERAAAWILAQSATKLQTNSSTDGYYASWDTTFDPFTWTAAAASSSGTGTAGGGSTSGTTGTGTGGSRTAAAFFLLPDGPDPAGNNVRYVIHRMCEAEGSAATVPCVSVAGASEGTSRGGLGGPGDVPLTNTAQVYYRITARVDGPKNARGFVQAMVY